MYPQSFVDRFWIKVDRKSDSECWNWNASLAGKGYGQVKPPKGFGRRNFYAHRVAFTLTYGGIPDGLEICHACDNPKCCNPKHLFAGTRAANATDMAMKMRSTWGERSGTAKLKSQDVIEIRGLLSEGLPQQAIAKQFGISQIQVSRIHTGKRWKKLEPLDPPARGSIKAL